MTFESRIVSEIINYLDYYSSEEEIIRKISFDFPIRIFLSADGHLYSPEIRVALSDLMNEEKISIKNDRISLNHEREFH